jgi:heat shock protein HtpX
MAWRAWTRWLGFALYTTLFFAIPLAILWGLSGLAVGITTAASFLFFLAHRAPERIVARLGAREIQTAESAALFALTREYCRRLGLPMPRLFLMESPALNLALFGHTRRRGYLVVTRGALTNLPRECLGALVARELTYLSLGETTLETTLSELLSLIDGLVMPRRTSGGQPAPRFYPFGLFVRQIVLYPFCLVPGFLLKRTHSAARIDEASVRVSRDALGLSEGLRWLQARYDRVPLPVAFSARHLFLLPPPAGDPLARVFFAGNDLGDRIRTVEKLRAAVTLG